MGWLISLSLSQLAYLSAHSNTYTHLIIAHAPCMCMHDVHAHHDVTRFAYDVNHITMTSPVFVFHSRHVGMRWHDVIGVCIGGTPCHHGSHCMGMM